MSAPLAQRLGAALRSARKRQDLSQQVVADRAGVSVSTVRDVERGAKGAELRSFEKVAEGLGTTIDALLIEVLCPPRARVQPFLHLALPYPPGAAGDFTTQIRRQLLELVQRLGPGPAKAPRR